MPHIGLASTIYFLTIIFLYCIIFIFTILIPYGNGSYSKIELSDSIYQNDDPDSFGYFAQFYRNEMEIIKQGIIPKYNEGVEYTISTCTYKDIQFSENKSCGNLTGLYNTELMIEQFNKIDKISNIIWIILIVLILINLIISASVYKLILPSTSNKISQQEIQYKYKKRILLFRYFRLAFIPLIIPASILVTYYNKFDNFFPNITGISYLFGGSFGFCIVSIVFNCGAVVSIIVGTGVYLIRKNNSDKSCETPNREFMPLKNKIIP
ncbi:hypothetical protein RB653_002266 [Dictyostelium firmibasis]|uniref:Uncharacterized protein n=1 Tax=Dictyostelium firmibasis TaxID=79012 RepID=A0AAN7YYL2_9MYCE